MFTINLKRTYVNPISGRTTWELSGDVEALMTYIEEKNRGKYRGEVIRGYRVNSKRRVTFKSGLGYDIISADLLGGSADGLARREAEEAGFEFNRG